MASVASHPGFGVHHLADGTTKLDTLCWCGSKTLRVDREVVLARRTESCGDGACTPPGGER